MIDSLTHLTKETVAAQPLSIEVHSGISPRNLADLTKGRARVSFPFSIARQVYDALGTMIYCNALEQRRRERDEDRLEEDTMLISWPHEGRTSRAAQLIFDKVM